LPEVEAVGEEGTVLGGDDDEEEEDCAGAAEVLALGALTFGVGTAAGAARVTGIVMVAGASVA
jgi:hypothetical protein